MTALQQQRIDKDRALLLKRAERELRSAIDNAVSNYARRSTDKNKPAATMARTK